MAIDPFNPTLLTKKRVKPGPMNRDIPSFVSPSDPFSIKAPDSGVPYRKTAPSPKDEFISSKITQPTVTQSFTATAPKVPSVPIDPLGQVGGQSPEVAKMLVDAEARRTATPAPAPAPSPAPAPAPAPAPSPQETAYRQAYADYITSLGSSGNVDAAKKKYLDFVQSVDTGLQNIADQPIAMPFISGQQASMANRAEIQGARLQGDLAMAQQAQQQQQAQALARLNFEQSLMEGEENKTAPITLSPGQIMYDPVTKMPIFSAPKESTGTVGEYEFYSKQEKDAGREPLTFDEYQTRDANRKAKAAGMGVDASDPLVNAVIDNPELWNQMTSTEKARIAPTLNSLGFSAFGKPLSDTAIKEITQSETAVEQLNELKKIVEENPEYIGPISGLQSLWPWSEAKQVQAKIDLVKQMVGKSLEGGVLRKEDEEKYKKILATMFDTPETAMSKINGLISTLTSNITTYKNKQALSGRNVPGETGAGDDLDAALESIGFRKVGGDTDQVSLTVTYGNGQSKQGGSASWRNNNPLNIKFGDFSKGYGAFEGTAATDGGVFAAFPDEATGLKAARDLLRAKSYSGLPLEQAMRRWSGDGYGADVAPASLRGKTTGQMTDAELNQLISSMRQREGWREGKTYA